MSGVSLSRLGPNVAELTLGEKVILFSYARPVAVRIGAVHYKTARFWSRATQAHLKAWLPAAGPVLVVTQEQLEEGI